MCVLLVLVTWKAFLSGASGAFADGGDGSGWGIGSCRDARCAVVRGFFVVAQRGKRVFRRCHDDQCDGGVTLRCSFIS